jgi:hypothetical protein
LASLIALPTPPAQAVQGIPYYLNFQGRLTDNNGNILPDGSYNVRFRIFNAPTGGSALWTGDRSYGASDHRMPVSNGLFSIQFGDTSQGDPALSPALFGSATQLYLEIELPSTATNACGTSNCAAWTEGPFTPRQPIAASPYAFNSDQLDGLDSGDFGQIAAANNFSATNTFSKSGGAGIILSGTPASSGSLLQIGGILSSGNASGTLIGANGAFTGDLINLQVSNATKLRVDSSGNLTLASGAKLTIGTSAGSTTTCSGGQFIQNQTTTGGIVTGGTCATPTGTGATTALDNLTTTSINANLLADSNNARDLGSAAKVWAHLYTALIDAGTTTTTLGIGTTNASAITVGKSGTTTTFNGPVTLAAGQSLTLSSGAGTLSQSYSSTTGTAHTLAVTDSAASGTTTVKGQSIALTGTNTSGTNNLYGFDFGNVTNPGGTNNFYAINVGTGYTDILRYNNATTLINGSGQFNGAQIQNNSIANTALTNNSITINGTGISGGGSVALGGTLNLATVYGSSANTAAQGNVTVTCPSGSGNLSGSGNTITLGSGGTCNALTTVNNPSFSTSVTSPSFTGTGAVTLSSGGSSALTLDSASNTLVIAASDTIIQRSAAGTTTLDLNSASATTLAITNAGSGVASLTVEGGITIGSGQAITVGSSTGSTVSCNGSQFLQGQTVAGGIVTGGTCGSLPVRSFIDTTVDAVVDNNTTVYWDNSAENGNTRPNIKLSDNTKEVFGILTMETQATGTADVEVTARMERSTSPTQSCNTGTAVGGQPGTFASNTNARKSSSATFVDSPATTSTLYYNVCADTDTVGTTANITRLRMTLFEVDNSNADLAEVYPSNDRTLNAGELISMDPGLKAGVKRTATAYDARIMGVMSTSPALTIGGKGTEGVTGIPVALTGRVPVRVSDEGGPIHAGDPLTSSSTPGVAMKATKAGYVIGRAMQDYTASGQGAILAFVGTHFYSPDPSVKPDVMQDVATLTNTTVSYILPKTKPGDCVTPGQQGTLYYDLAAGAISVCSGNQWQDVPTVADLQLFGIQSDSGPNGQEGDLASLVTRGASGPCKVSYAGSTSVHVESCTAYSAGKKVKVKAATLSTSLTNANPWNHLCLTGDAGQPQILAAPNESANLPFSRTAPVVCLADITNGGSGSGIHRIYDTRTFTATTKEFVTINDSVGIGQIVVQSDTDGLVAIPTKKAGAYGVRGVVVASSGAASASTSNLIIATAGPQFVKAAGSSKAGQVAQTSSQTRGYTSGTPAATADGYASLGLDQRTIDTTCTISACQFSQLINLMLR